MAQGNPPTPPSPPPSKLFPHYKHIWQDGKCICGAGQCDASTRWNGPPRRCLNRTADPAAFRGVPFDPKIHEAVIREENPSVPSQTVVAVLQKGYFLHDRLLSLLSQNQTLRYVGRPISASPATGSHHRHEEQQRAIVASALE